MVIIKERYAIQELAKFYKLHNIYDLLNRLKETTDAIACTDGKNIYVNPEEFNERTPQDAFFILCHEFMHIVYRHTDNSYYTIKDYPNRKVLNVCQDVVINEFLADKLGYHTHDGMYLNNFLDYLRHIGLHLKSYYYHGDLTTKALYTWVMDQVPDDVDEDELFKDLPDPDFKEQSDEERQSLPIPKELVESMSKALKVTEKEVSKELGFAVTKEDIADLNKTLIDTDVPTTISAKDMIKFIQNYIGNNAIVKGRSRTYARPSRRHQSNDYILPGYKHYKNINKVNVYLDTSGSMSESLIAELYSTLRVLHKTTPFNLFQFTTNIYSIDIDTKKDIYVGGGTDIQKVLNKIESEHAEYSIVITDCNDQFSLKNITQPLMIFTNDTRFKSDNSNVKLAYFHR